MQWMKHRMVTDSLKYKASLTKNWSAAGKLIWTPVAMAMLVTSLCLHSWQAAAGLGGWLWLTFTTRAVPLSFKKESEAPDGPVKT